MSSPTTQPNTGIRRNWEGWSLSGVLVLLTIGIVGMQTPSSQATSGRVPSKGQKVSLTVSPSACTITVNSPVQEVTLAAPEGVRNGNCTLGEAILAANGNPNITECPCAGGSPVTIQLQAGMTYTLTTVATTLYGPTGLPAISSTIVIEGNGAVIERSSLGGTPAFRLFSIAGTINGVQAVETNPDSTTPAPNTLLPAGNLTLRTVTLRNGLTLGGLAIGNGGGGLGSGGAIFNAGSLTIDSCTLSGNQVVGGGSFCCEPGGGGGGMGGLGGPGAVGIGGGGGGGMAGSGAGSTIMRTGGGGGGTVNNGNSNSSGGSLNGGNGGLSANGSPGGFGGGGGGNGRFPGIGGAGGFGGGGGGAIDGIGGNGGFGGGGGAGGGAFNPGIGGFGGGGGGQQSGLGGNLGGFGGGFGGSNGGGGGGLGGAVFSTGMLDLTNSTLSGNSAVGGFTSFAQSGSGLGAGLFVRNGTTTVANCTFNNNTASRGNGAQIGAHAGGCLYVLGDGETATVTVVNSIFANSTSIDGGVTDAFINTINSGTVTQTGNATNLVEVNGGGANALLGVTQMADPNLEVLALNGGLTETHLPQPGSPVINNGSGSRPNNVDQRGLSASCRADIGAVEIQGMVPSISAVLSSGETICNGSLATLTVTVTGGTAPYSVMVANYGFVGVPDTNPFTFNVNPASDTTYAIDTVADANECAGSSSGSATVIVRLPPVAKAGVSQTICEFGTTTTLVGNSLSPHETGLWSVVSGGTGTLSNATNPNTTFTHTGGAGPITLRWTVSNPPCLAAMAEVTITIQPPATVNAGPDQTVLTTNPTAMLAATFGNGATSGIWTGGAGVFTDASDPNTTYTATQSESNAGMITLTFTTDDPPGPCGPVSDSVTIFLRNPVGLMVADTTNHRIQGFDGTQWIIIGVGTIGTGPGQFRLPEAVTCSPNIQRIYVADTGNNRIQWSTDSGATWANFATLGSGLNQVRVPQGLALDGDGNLYVSDTGNGRVLRFNGGVPGAGVVIATNGAASGQVGSPRGLAIDATFRLFVTDESNSRILRISNANTTVSGTSGTILASFGTGMNQVKNPQGITIDDTGTLFVADTGNSRILRWANANPASASTMALTGSGLGQVNRPEGVTISQFLNGPLSGAPVLIVGDTSNHRIQGRFLPTGQWNLIGSPNGIGTGVGQFRSPSKIR
ncbi:MAG: NHL repeat-containing protein [Acidobacteria bacterium]|nr:NHL repeat-containing protein [Acidobacteriota bacterium]